MRRWRCPDRLTGKHGHLRSGPARLPSFRRRRQTASRLQRHRQGRRVLVAVPAVAELAMTQSATMDEPRHRPVAMMSTTRRKPMRVRFVMALPPTCRSGSGRGLNDSTPQQAILFARTMGRLFISHTHEDADAAARSSRISRGAAYRAGSRRATSRRERSTPMPSRRRCRVRLDVWCSSPRPLINRRR